MELRYSIGKPVNQEITRNSQCFTKSVKRIIKWNIAFGVAFNAAAVVAGGSGYLSPIMGAVVHNIGSVLVVLASASLAFTPEKVS